MTVSHWPEFNEDQINAVINILRRGAVKGNSIETRSFEREFSNYIGVNRAIAIANGSLALSSAYLALGIGKGDEVITTPRTFIATASSVALLGAKPIFADVDKDSGNICPKSIETLISKKTKAIVVVHLAGWPADMAKIISIARKYKIHVVEDCAQAHGAGIYEGGELKKVGSFGNVSAWSFCQDKIISTGGEGGMITTNDEKIYKKILSFKDHGKNTNFLENNNTKNKFAWVHDNFGSNFRLTEIQSNIGRLQLKLLDNWNHIRKRNADIIIQELAQLDLVRIPEIPKNIKHAWYKFYCYVNIKNLSSDWSRDRIIKEINFKGFPCFSGTCSEIYLERCFLKNGISPKKRLPNAKELGDTSLMFLIDPTISVEKMTQYTNVIKKILVLAKL